MFHICDTLSNSSHWIYQIAYTTYIYFIVFVFRTNQFEEIVGHFGASADSVIPPESGNETFGTGQECGEEKVTDDCLIVISFIFNCLCEP